MSDLHEPFGKDMLKESADKFHGVKGCGLPCFLLTIFVLKLNDMIFNAFDAIIRDGDSKHIS